jgi:hypothetical protein
MYEWLKKNMCAYFHGGGRIKRDAVGRINWQCDKCGRWADPVPLEEEEKIIEMHIAKNIRARGNE